MFPAGAVARCQVPGVATWRVRTKVGASFGKMNVLQDKRLDFKGFHGRDPCPESPGLRLLTTFRTTAVRRSPASAGVRDFVPVS